jgi:hypothetical protein
MVQNINNNGELSLKAEKEIYLRASNEIKLEFDNLKLDNFEDIFIQTRNEVSLLYLIRSNIQRCKSQVNHRCISNLFFVLF